MRILYIAGETVPGRNGGSVHVWEVATNLARIGHSVTAVVRRQPGQPRSETLSGVEFIRARMSLAGKTMPLLAMPHLAPLALRGYDLVIDRYVTFGGLGAVFSMLTGTPLVLEVNSPHVDELIWRLGVRAPALKAMLHAWVGMMFRRAALVISPLKSIVPAFARHKVREVAWAANLEMFDADLRKTEQGRQIRTQCGLTDKTVVLFLGTFREWHGVLALPDIIRYVVKRKPDAKFLLVGDGDCLPAVKDRIESDGTADHVAIAGAVPYEHVPYYIAAADVGIAPYDVDAYPMLKKFGFFWSPLKIFEYMAGGLPVVTVDVPPLNGIVDDGVRGYVVPCRDVAANGEAILRLLASPAARAAMGKRAQEFVAMHYGWQDHVRHLDQLFAETI